MFGLRRFEVFRAGASVAQDAAALDEPLALLVALGEGEDGEVEVLHALEREVFELFEAEVAGAGARVYLEVPGAGAGVCGARVRLVEGVLAGAGARLQLDRLGVVAMMARRDQHARVLTPRLRLLRVIMAVILHGQLPKYLLRATTIHFFW